MNDLKFAFRQLLKNPGFTVVLRIRPALGRMFLPSDANESAEPVVMISHELWQARFRGNPEVIGQTLRLDEKSHTVVGILPPETERPSLAATFVAFDYFQ